MIGPPGLPKVGRPVSSLARDKRGAAHDRWRMLKWAGGLYLAGVVAHSGHHMAYYLSEGIGLSLAAGLTEAPTSLAWPADLIATLMALV